MTAKPRHPALGEALRWALDASADPAMASADWLALDIDPSATSAIALITDPRVPLAHLHRAKDVFKTMRIVGESASDRRIGARLYAAAIAAGLVRHGRRISRQSDAALERAFQALVDDTTLPQALRHLGGAGLCAMREAR